MTRPRTALVIGGGIAGPATAMALARAGIEATVCEARAEGAEGAGAFLTVASNGIDALRVLGADEPVLAAGFPTPAITLRSGTGKRLGESRTGGTLPDGTVSHTLTRAALHDGLRGAALARGVRIEHGRRLVAAHDAGDEVVATFADGSEAAADVLIGCDGVHSAVRRIIDPGAPAPSYAGLVTTGGIAGGVAVDAAAGSYEMIFGRRAFFGYAAAPGGEVWWFANLPRRGEPAAGELRAAGGEGWRERLLAAYADDAGPALSLIRATPVLFPVTPIHAMPHLPVWHRGRMIVVGDAAHAPSPTSGQGASLSIEDAVVLAMRLRDLPGPEAAFARFEAERRPRVERIVKWAARMNSSKAAGPVGRVVRDAMMPAVLRLADGSRAHRLAYEHHLEWGAPAVPA
jgi:2-polyprenyl-6-methoxyphenol hydroxylase-like FAD-dependent oxidoreductase